MKKRAPKGHQKPNAAGKSVKSAAEALEKFETGDTDTEVRHIKAEAQADRSKAVNPSQPKVKYPLTQIESQKKEDNKNNNKP